MVAEGRATAAASGAGEAEGSGGGRRSAARLEEEDARDSPRLATSGYGLAWGGDEVC